MQVLTLRSSADVFRIQYECCRARQRSSIRLGSVSPFSLTENDDCKIETRNLTSRDEILNTMHTSRSHCDQTRQKAKGWAFTLAQSNTSDKRSAWGTNLRFCFSIRRVVLARILSILSFTVLYLLLTSDPCINAVLILQVSIQPYTVLQQEKRVETVDVVDVIP